VYVGDTWKGSMQARHPLKTVDYSDVRVIDAAGRETPWNQVSRIDQDEMKELITGVVNRIHTFLARTIYCSFNDQQFNRALDRTLCHERVVKGAVRQSTLFTSALPRRQDLPISLPLEKATPKPGKTSPRVLRLAGRQRAIFDTGPNVYYISRLVRRVGQSEAPKLLSFSSTFPPLSRQGRIRFAL
jgi:hypothetical protein